MSFAKVAASLSTDNHSNNHQAPSVRAMKENSRGSFAPTQMSGPIILDGPQDRTSSFLDVQQPQTLNTIMRPRHQSSIDSVAQSLGNFGLGPAAPSAGIKSNGSTIDNEQPTSRESGSDDSQKADSSSELGTKPPSLDGKSITSGTTFALDEKESLRPDDSASVKAAGEDDDAFSVRGSLIAGSRMGSDLAGRTRAIQLGDMPERRLMQVTSRGSNHGILTPQSTSSGPPTGNVPEIAGLQRADPSSDALNLIYRHAPDDQLIEAMASTKDRLFLLKLEKEVIDFVQNSKEPYMDLPPSNSFCRMLTHKLADYYHMTHSFEPNIGSVRIFRTPFCRVPTSLAQWDSAPDPTSNDTPPPIILPKKIMRRGQEGNIGTDSNSPSKATSEAGSEGKDGKDKQGNHTLTREEREEMYKLARERIFGTSEESSTIDTEGDAGMSQASSVSGNNRSTMGKRTKSNRQRRDDSDSFDSRNQYTQYWGPQQTTWVQQPLAAPGNQFAAAQYAPIYQAPAAYASQPFNNSVPNMPPMIPRQAHPAYQGSQPQPQQRPPTGGNPLPLQGPPPMHVQGNAQQQAWQSNYAAAYQPRSAAPPGPQPPPGVPYPFGQLPSNLNPYDPKSQHPIPGSYNRNHTFNPMTQSFVPGSNMMQPVNAPQPPFTAPASHHGSPQTGSTHLAFPQYQQGVSQPYPGGYGMIRQASNNSLPGYHAPQQHVPVPYGQHTHPANPVQHHSRIQQMPLHPSHHMATQPNLPQQQVPPQMYNHLPTYGNPTTLPQKPATGL